MTSIIARFSIIGMVILSSCTTDPPPPTMFSAKITVKNPGGTPVAGLRISAWNHLPLTVFHSSQRTTDRLASPLSVSEIRFSTASRARINLSVFEFDGSLASTLVDEILPAGPHEVQWDNDAHKPPRVYYYRLIAEDSATGVLLFRDSLYAVLWHVDSEIAILGWSSSAGTFETTDKLLFPNVLNLPTLVLTKDTPDSLNTFSIPDTVSITLTDTATHQQMTFDRVIKKGVANNIELVWNPPVTRQRISVGESTLEQRAAVQTRRVELGLVEWRLYQNYPNPFN